MENLFLIIISGKFVFKLSFLSTVEPREKTKRRHREKEKAPSHGGRPQKSKVD